MAEFIYRFDPRAGPHEIGRAVVPLRTPVSSPRTKEGSVELLALVERRDEGWWVRTSDLVMTLSRQTWNPMSNVELDQRRCVASYWMHQ